MASPEAKFTTPSDPHTFTDELGREALAANGGEEMHAALEQRPYSIDWKPNLRHIAKGGLEILASQGRQDAQQALRNFDDLF